MTPRERLNKLIKIDIDQFAERMKRYIDDTETLLKRHEQLENGTAQAIDESSKEAKGTS